MDGDGPAYPWRIPGPLRRDGALIGAPAERGGAAGARSAHNGLGAEGPRPVGLAAGGPAAPRPPNAAAPLRGRRDHFQSRKIRSEGQRCTHSPQPEHTSGSIWMPLGPMETAWYRQPWAHRLQPKPSQGDRSRAARAGGSGPRRCRGRRGRRPAAVPRSCSRGRPSRIPPPR